MKLGPSNDLSFDGATVVAGAGDAVGFCVDGVTGAGVGDGFVVGGGWVVGVGGGGEVAFCVVVGVEDVVVGGIGVVGFVAGVEIVVGSVGLVVGGKVDEVVLGGIVDEVLSGPGAGGGFGGLIVVDELSVSFFISGETSTEAPTLGSRKKN